MLDASNETEDSILENNTNTSLAVRKAPGHKRGKAKVYDRYCSFDKYEDIVQGIKSVNQQILLNLFNILFFSSKI